MEIDFNVEEVRRAMMGRIFTGNIQGRHGEVMVTRFEFLGGEVYHPGWAVRIGNVLYREEEFMKEFSPVGFTWAELGKRPQPQQGGKKK